MVTLNFFLRRGLLMVVGMVISVVKFIVLAQGAGAAGIAAAETEITSLFDPASKLILAIGAIVGLIGGVRVYIKWNTGDQDVMKTVMGWGGACLFLVVVAMVIKAFFL